MLCRLQFARKAWRPATELPASSRPAPQLPAVEPVPEPFKAPLFSWWRLLVHTLSPSAVSTTWETEYPGSCFSCLPHHGRTCDVLKYRSLCRVEWEGLWQTISCDESRNEHKEVLKSSSWLDCYNGTGCFGPQLQIWEIAWSSYHQVSIHLLQP